MRAQDGLALRGEVAHGPQVALELPHRRSVALLPRPHAHEQQLVSQRHGLGHTQPEEAQRRDALVAGECQEVLGRGGTVVRLECRAVTLLGQADRRHMCATAAARQPHHLAARHQRQVDHRIWLRARLRRWRRWRLVLECLGAHSGLLPAGARQEACVDLVTMRRAVESARPVETKVTAAEAALDVAEVARAVEVEDPLDEGARLDALQQLRGLEVALALRQRVVLAIEGRAAPQPSQLREGHVHPVRTKEAAVGACEGLQLGQRLERQHLAAATALGRPGSPRRLRATSSTPSTHGHLDRVRLLRRLRLRLRRRRLEAGRHHAQRDARRPKVLHVHRRSAALEQVDATQHHRVVLEAIGCRHLGSAELAAQARRRARQEVPISLEQDGLTRLGAEWLARHEGREAQLQRREHAGQQPPREREGRHQPRRVPEHGAATLLGRASRDAQGGGPCSRQGGDALGPGRPAWRHRRYHGRLLAPAPAQLGTQRSHEGRLT
eukprot:scaffold81157_cov60-Phaeocystis_antarctica.AAC.3